MRLVSKGNICSGEKRKLSVSITPVCTWVWATKHVRFSDLEFGSARQQVWFCSFLPAL